RSGLTGGQNQSGRPALMNLPVLARPTGGRETELAGQWLESRLLGAGQMEPQRTPGTLQSEIPLGVALRDEAKAVQVPGDRSPADSPDMPRTCDVVSLPDVRVGHIDLILALECPIESDRMRRTA